MIEKKIDQIIREVPNFPKQGINFKDISVKNNNLGKPQLYLSKKIKSFLSHKLKYKKYKIHLSLSDENRHSIAFVIINKI